MTSPPEPESSDHVRALPARDQQMIQALAKKDLAQVMQCLRQGANPDAEADRGMPVLVLTALRGEPQLTEALLKAGAHIDVKLSGQTALMWLAALAVSSAQFSCAKILIDAGADLSQKNQIGRTALDIAISWENREMADLLKRSKAPCSKTSALKLKSLLAGFDCDSQGHHRPPR